MRNSFILYTSWGAMIEKMSAEQAGQIMKACYALERGEEYEITDDVASIVFATFKEAMDKDREAYEEKCRKNSENVRKRSITTDNDREQSEGDIDNDIDIESDKQEKRKTEQKEKPFSRPTVEEVREYCHQRKNQVDPEAFMDFYASKGWKVGNQTMKDWKAAVRTWEKRDRPKARQPDKWKPKDERSYDFDELERRLLAR